MDAEKLRVSNITQDAWELHFRHKAGFLTRLAYKLLGKDLPMPVFWRCCSCGACNPLMFWGETTGTVDSGNSHMGLGCGYCGQYFVLSLTPTGFKGNVN